MITPPDADRVRSRGPRHQDVVGSIANHDGARGVDASLGHGLKQHAGIGLSGCSIGRLDGHKSPNQIVLAKKIVDAATAFTGSDTEQAPRGFKLCNDVLGVGKQWLVLFTLGSPVGKNPPVNRSDLNDFVRRRHGKQPGKDFAKRQADTRGNRFGARLRKTRQIRGELHSARNMCVTIDQGSVEIKNDQTAAQTYSSASFGEKPRTSNKRVMQSGNGADRTSGFAP